LLAAQVTLNGELAHFFPDFFQVTVGQILDLLGEGDTDGLANFFCAVGRPMP
jgi:hypothetical protein